MTTPSTFWLARPSFWPEPRAPEAWLRALAELDRLLKQPDPPVLAGPWPTWERHLNRLLSRRSVPGLFGLETQGPQLRLWGAGFLRIPQGGSTWTMADEVEAVLNEHLAENAYFLGDTFSAADILVGGGINFLLMFKVMNETPVLKGYCARLTARPAFQRMMQKDQN